MMSSAIEAVYIFNQQYDCILEHVYRSRPVPPKTLLALYQAKPAPRPSVTYFPRTNPPTTLFSIIHAGLLFFVPSSTDTEALFVLEFLHRLVEVLEDFLGAPLLASKIEGAYDVVAQLLGEMCDAGNVCNTEPNALRDMVDVPRWMDKILGGVSLPGSSPGLGPPKTLKQQLSLKPLAAGPAVPWRRSNVRHTSNELYVDIVETLCVTLAPSGRPLAAFANGSIAFTSKISGVPDLLLTLSVPGGKQALPHVLELPVFHPCVRLARWKERPGELSFVPPDGRFMLAGYEVNLLPDPFSAANTPQSLNLPLSLEVTTSLGPTGSDFEARLLISPTFTAPPTSSNTSRPTPFSRSAARSTPSFFTSNTSSSSSSTVPTLQDLFITIPIPPSVRNITDLRPSRGEAHFTPTDSTVEWRIGTKEASTAGTITLRCTVVGQLSSSTPSSDPTPSYHLGNGDYDEDEVEPYQSAAPPAVSIPTAKGTRTPTTATGAEARDWKRVEENKGLMPTAARASFSVNRWVASGVKVESLVVDTKRSRGLGEGVRPVKGVKYLTVSRGGVETRC